MSKPTKAIFLSYASQDTAAARRICDALRAAGLDVWFDQSELRGGEAWDASIRQQIQECALFVPIISASTNARSEGYFRLEWKLAIDRSHRMADEQAFLLPVLIDDLPKASARVPDRLRERQWVQLFADESPAVMVERVRRLLFGAPASGSAGMPSATDRADTSSGSASAEGSDRPGASRFWAYLNAGGRFWGGLVATAAIAALLIGAVIYRNAHQVADKVTRAPTDASAAAAASHPLSLAILPFTNATGDPKLAYVADGLTASLSSNVTTNLAVAEDAFVTPAAITAAYKDKAAPAPLLGKELGVHFVLQGSVQKAGSKIRFTAELIDAVAGMQLWTETYDGDESNLLALQDRVRRNEDFESKLYLAAARNSEARKVKPTATDFYVRGFALEFGNGSVQTKQQELGLFRQMLALEPNNPKAMICVASALTDVATASYAHEADRSETERYFSEGRELAMKAKALGSNNPWVYEVPALYAKFHDDYPGWLENSKAWQQADPNNLVPVIYVANAYLNGGEPQKALPLLQQALDMDHSPPRWSQLRFLGKALFMLGDTAGAVEILQRARSVEPSDERIYAYLAAASAAQGDMRAAHAAVAELHRQNPQFAFHAFERLEAPMPSAPPAYRTWWESKLVPQWHAAGLAQ